MKSQHESVRWYGKQQKNIFNIFISDNKFTIVQLILLEIFIPLDGLDNQIFHDFISLLSIVKIEKSLKLE